jgi:site-specific recombinase XerD
VPDERENTGPQGLFDVLTREFRFCNYIPNTVKAYKSTIHSFSQQVKHRHPRDLTKNDIRNVLLIFIDGKNLASSTVNQVFNAPA